LGLRLGARGASQSHGVRDSRYQSCLHGDLAVLGSRMVTRRAVGFERACHLRRRRRTALASRVSVSTVVRYIREARAGLSPTQSAPTFPYRGSAPMR